MEYSIEDFCKNPNNITISKFSPEVLEILYNKYLNQHQF